MKVFYFMLISCLNSWHRIGVLEGRSLEHSFIQRLERSSATRAVTIDLRSPSLAITKHLLASTSSKPISTNSSRMESHLESQLGCGGGTKESAASSAASRSPSVATTCTFATDSLNPIWTSASTAACHSMGTTGPCAVSTAFALLARAASASSAAMREASASSAATRAASASSAAALAATRSTARRQASALALEHLLHLFHQIRGMLLELWSVHLLKCLLRLLLNLWPVLLKLSCHVLDLLLNFWLVLFELSLQLLNHRCDLLHATHHVAHVEPALTWGVAWSLLALVREAGSHLLKAAHHVEHAEVWGGLVPSTWFRCGGCRLRCWCVWRWGWRRNF